MKITGWNDNYIYFSDGSSITYDHRQDCCEDNWADFSVLEIFYNNEEFESYTIKPVEDAGFLLCLKMTGYCFDVSRNIFIPCYSDQNGYYSTDIDILVYKEGQEVESIGLYCELCLN